MKAFTKALFLYQLHAASAQLRGGKSNNEDRELGVFDSNTRIIGGAEASRGRYSYAVSLSDRIGHFCGGSLICPDVVLTAAHCQGGEYDAIIGRHDLRSNDGEEISVKTELPHPSYDPHTTDNDFMLVFLDRETNESVDFVKISPDVVAPSTSVTVMGWGDTHISDYVSELADELMEVEVQTISNRECERSSGNIGGWEDNYHDQITDNMLCAEDVRAEDACQGDSGGPLVIHSSSGDQQVGVVSWGIGCAHKDFPGVYGRVSSQYDWIKSEVCKRSSSPPADFNCDGAAQSSVSAVAVQTDDFSTVAVQSFTNGNWRKILSEDFKSGLGPFKGSDRNTKVYTSAKGKSGVVRIQNKSSFQSGEIILDRNYSKFKARFNYYALQMEADDKFCFDSSINGKSWKEIACWDAAEDFTNKRWLEESVEFSAGNAESLKVRFRCVGNNNKDDVLFDNVQVEGLV